jgi:hypothetical protein
MTAPVVERWTFRRNLVIYVARKHGVSDRLLADVFDLTVAQVRAILDDCKILEMDSGPGGTDGDTAP